LEWHFAHASSVTIEDLPPDSLSQGSTFFDDSNLLSAVSASASSFFFCFMTAGEFSSTSAGAASAFFSASAGAASAGAASAGAGSSFFCVRDYLKDSNHQRKLSLVKDYPAVSLQSSPLMHGRNAIPIVK
jgi:hypothetical protein